MRYQEVLLRAFAFFTVWRWPRHRWYILLYHDVPKNCAEAFEKQVKWLKERFEVATISEALRRLGDARHTSPLLTITFDDAEKSVYETVLPILEGHNLKACTYAVPGYVKQRKFELGGKIGFAMHWSELKEWLARGHEVGAHSLTHIPLTYCSDQRLCQELLESKNILEDKLGIEILHFAYPFGIFNRRIETLIREQNIYYTVATTRRGTNSPKSCTYRLYRIQVHPGFRPQDVALRMRAAERFGWVWRLRSAGKYAPARPTHLFDEIPQEVISDYSA